MEFPPEVTAVLDELVATPTDEGRIVLEQANIPTPNAGLHDGDPQEQPE